MGGDEGLSAMRDYQQAAIELGFLHYRYLRGTPPPDFAARGQEYVARIAQVRPFDRLPRTGGAPAMSQPMSLSPVENTQMLTALVRLRGALQHAALPLELPGVAEQRAALREMVDQLEDYVIPRVMTLDAPLLAVVGGSTGAGKSTLVNSLVGTRVTEPGVLRPTTRSPVLVHNPADAAWFGQDRLLPDLERVDRRHHRPGRAPARAEPTGARGARDPRRARRRLGRGAEPDAGRPAARRRRPLAVRHLGGPLRRPGAVGASCARPPSALPPVAIVLDRTPPDAVDTVAAHLARMLA